MKDDSSNRARDLRELGKLFLKLGTIGFGGPAAHVGLMENEVVRRRAWLTREQFLDLLSAANLIPGPNSTELAIHIGHARAGFPGLIVAGSCFILPALAIVMVCAWAYKSYGTLPQADGILYGVKPVIIAVIVQALYGLIRSAVKNRGLGALAVAATALYFAGTHELVLLFGAGVFMMAARRVAAPKNPPALSLAAGLMALTTFLSNSRLSAADAAKSTAAATALGAAAPAAASAFGLMPLFLFFLKVGSVLYGSGYVLLAFLRSDLVERWHWLSEAQLLDAIAVGQVTPGPLFTTATFIGYQLGGIGGGLVATAGIFLPAFFFVAISGPLIPRLRKSALAAAFLDGVNIASLALMAVVTWQLTASALLDVPTVILALASAALLIRYRINSAWLVLGGGILGLLLH